MNDIAVNRKKETVNAIYLVCTYTLNVLYLACTCIFIGFVFQQVNVDLFWCISACTYLLIYIFNICLTSSGARFSRSRIPPKKLNRIHSQMQYLNVQYFNECILVVAICYTYILLCTRYDLSKTVKTTTISFTGCIMPIRFG